MRILSWVSLASVLVLAATAVSYKVGDRTLPGRPRRVEMQDVGQRKCERATNQDRLTTEMPSSTSIKGNEEEQMNSDESIHDRNVPDENGLSLDVVLPERLILGKAWHAQAVLTNHRKDIVAATPRNDGRDFRIHVVDSAGQDVRLTAYGKGFARRENVIIDMSSGAWCLVEPGQTFTWKLDHFENFCDFQPGEYTIEVAIVNVVIQSENLRPASPKCKVTFEVGSPE